jgi:hypothetical protein
MVGIESREAGPDILKHMENLYRQRSSSVISFIMKYPFFNPEVSGGSNPHQQAPGDKLISSS